MHFAEKTRFLSKCSPKHNACDDQSKYFSTHGDWGICHMRAIVLRACRKWISFRVAGTCRRSSPPNSWGWTGQEHEQRSGSHPSSPPPGLPTTFPPPATFPPSFSQLTSTIQASSEARPLLKKELGKSPLSIVPFLSLLQITPRADSNT